MIAELFHYSLLVGRKCARILSRSGSAMGIIHGSSDAIGLNEPCEPNSRR